MIKVFVVLNGVQKSVTDYKNFPDAMTAVLSGSLVADIVPNIQKSPNEIILLKVVVKRVTDDKILFEFVAKYHGNNSPMQAPMLKTVTSEKKKVPVKVLATSKAPKNKKGFTFNLDVTNRGIRIDFNEK